MSRITSLVLVSCLLPAAVAVAQTARPTLTKVTITAPQGTPQSPFRTNRELISIDFSSDAANGYFFATSVGADIPMSTFLAGASSGKVGAGLATEGLKQIQVTVSSGGSIPTSWQVSVTSSPVTVVVDKTPPQFQITLIKLRDNGIFEAYDPNRIYHTNSTKITLRGWANDGGLGVPPNQITISVTGVMTPSSTKPDASGQWELPVDISREPDGPIDMKILANDNVGGERFGNRSEKQVGLR